MIRFVWILPILAAAGDGRGADRAGKQAEPVPYEVVSKQVAGDFTSSKMIWKVVLASEGIPSSDQIKNTVTGMWRDGNNLWSRFVVFVYLPEMEIEDAAYCIAEFFHGGLGSFTIQDFALQDVEVPASRPPPPEPRDDRKVVRYALELSVSRTGSRKLDVGIVTDFPDSTNLVLTARRPYYIRGGTEEQYGTILEKLCPVVDGAYTDTLALDESDWYYRRLREGESGAGEFAGFRSISPRVIVEARYSPDTPQPETVRSVLGPRGEYVSGPNVSSEEEGTVVRVTRVTEVHFEK